MKYANDKQILEKLDMSGRRLSHTKAVADECDELAKLFKLSEADAEMLHTAALLHDCTKEYKAADQVKLCEKYGIKYTRDDLDSPKVFHAVTGAAYAKDVFGASDEICACIAKHTTGSPDMTLCEKLLYLADYIEATRTFDDCVALRKFFHKAVEKSAKPLSDILCDTLILSFDMTIKNLLSDGETVHPATIEARNSLIRQKKQESDK